MDSLTNAILYECDDFVAIQKPAGVLSQKDKSGIADLSELLKKEWTARGKKCSFLAPVHRLDRNTSGIMLLAKSSKAAQILSNAILAGELHRTYLAVAKGDPGEKGDYKDSLLKDEQKNIVSVHPKGEIAHTAFLRLEKMGNSSLMQVTLHTGRSHQIRVHFSHHGHALLGDKKYAKKPWSEIFSRPALHAWKLQFPKDLYNGRLLVAPLPEDLSQLLHRLGCKTIP